MHGASRTTYAELREKLAAVTASVSGNAGEAIAQQAGDELFAVTRLLDRERGLRRALADATKPAAEKSAIARGLLRGKVSQTVEDLVAQAAEGKWATPGDLSDAVEQLGIEALAIAAQRGDRLDDLEDDLFRFSRVVSAQPGLRDALKGSADVSAKQSLLANLLSSKVSAESLSLITSLLTYPRGRSPQAVLDLAAGIAAQRREQLIAVVRVATELTPAQRQRLLTALQATYGKGVHVNVVYDPEVLGGMSVQIGDELIDGTAQTRVGEVRRKLAS